MIILINLFVFITLFFIIFYILNHFIKAKNLILRLNKYTNIQQIQKERTMQDKEGLKSGLKTISGLIINIKFLDFYRIKISKKLATANILLKSEEYIVICIGAFLVMFIITVSVKNHSDFSILYGFLVGLVGWKIPGVILNFKINKRLKTLNNQLSDAIVLISNSLKAGHSFFQAIDIVSKEMMDPIRQEFSILQKEINLGIPTETALENLAKRIPSDDLGLVITAVLIQRQVGGNLSEVLDNISYTIKERVRMKGEIKTVTAQGRISGLIISLLPVILGIILYLINKDHMSILFNDVLGIAILGFSIFMELLGIYFIRKIVDIEV